MPDLALPNLPSFPRTSSRKSFRHFNPPDSHPIPSPHSRNSIDAPSPSTKLRRKSSYRDPRRTRTSYNTSATQSRLISLKLSAQPIITLLIHHYSHATTWRSHSSPILLTVHTASSVRGDWQCITTSTPLPAVVQVPCQSFQLDTRLVRLCLYRPHRTVRHKPARSKPAEIGSTVIRVRDLVDPSHTSSASGGGGGIFIAAVHGHPVGSIGLSVNNRRRVGNCNLHAVVGGMQSGHALHLSLTPAISVIKDVKGCVLELLRKGGGRQTLTLARTDFGKLDPKQATLNIAGPVLWFGLTEDDVDARVVAQVVRVGRFAKRVVVGTLQISLRDLAVGGWTTGHVADVRWMGSRRMGVVDTIDRTQRCVKLSLRITR